ncbi:hypothetical protein [Sphingomonas melonis]|uniref:Uncharacterized protein n=1 Tax=Sphingomonas melonis TaxID=152682 RepID=A0A7Y9FK10_9SPHN|nr:hypothetical protein [Sphingomonas melonis]NYD88733.1 hypothetical protein [Sphingomonas melonis]
MSDIKPVPDEYGYILSPITDGTRFSDMVERAQENGTLQKVGTYPPTLWGPDGSLARFTRAAKGIHNAAEKVRAMRMNQTDQEVEAVAQAIYGGDKADWLALPNTKVERRAAGYESAFTRDDFRDDARAAILRLDQVREGRGK